MLFEFLSSLGVDVCQLSWPESLEIEDQWRAIYGNAFVGRPRMRVGVKAEAEYAQVECAHYWIVPFNFNLAGTAVSVTKHGQCAFECRGIMPPLGRFQGIEFFVSPIDFAWTMVHTHEDHACGGPYFMRQEWIP